MRQVAEKLMRRIVPLCPLDRQAQPKSGAGRHPSLKPEEIEQGIRILRSLGKMTMDAACETLEEAGISGSEARVPA